MSFKVLDMPPEVEPAQRLKCDCGEEFWVDPCGEENLVWSDKRKSLIALCPGCNKINE
jgi:hypothetical protein